MATYTRQEYETLTVEYLVPFDEPWGACWVEVQKALAAMINDLERRGVISKGSTPSDDMIRVHANDEYLVIRWEGRAS